MNGFVRLRNQILVMTMITDLLAKSIGVVESTAETGNVMY
jgi:hypothetical protein